MVFKKTTYIKNKKIKLIADVHATDLSRLFFFVSLFGRAFVLTLSDLEAIWNTKRRCVEEFSTVEYI